MKPRMPVGWVVLLFVALAAGVARGALAQEPSPRSLVRSAREFLRIQRFDSALKQLQRLKKPGAYAAEAARLEATASLGKALQEDFAATEAMDAIHFAGTAKHTLRSMMQEPSQAEFIKEVEGQITGFLGQSAPVAESWPAHFRQVLQSLEQARISAKRAYDLEPISSAHKEEAAALWAGSELYEYLATREAQQAILRADTAEVFTPELMDSIRKVLPRERQPDVAEPRCRVALVRLIPEATASNSPRLSLALAETCLLYSAARDRLRPAGFGARRRRPASAPPPPPLPKEPAALPTGKALEERLNTEPESLILPLYQVAAKDDKAQDSLAASYGLYFSLLAQHEEEAGRVLEQLLQRYPRSTALLLEKARQAAMRKETDATRAGYFRALQAGPLQRPLFVSLPPEVRSLWIASRPVTQLAPQFLPTYSSLAGGIVSAPAGEPPDPTAIALQQLRLSALLMRGNFMTDVVDGVWSAEEALQRLQNVELAGNARVLVAATQRELKQTTARLPTSLTHPHLTFSTYTVLPDGRKQPLRTLTISRSGFSGFGRYPPSL